MIPFFRKIRKKMADDNKPMKYLRYAIGEIVLVVIGILIALSINNWNESRKNEEKLLIFFSEIQKELSVNINKTTKLIDFYKQKDSLISLVLQNKVNEHDYQNNLNLGALLFNYNLIQFRDNGYLKLKDNSNIIPPKYQPILNKLSTVFEVNKVTTETIQNQLIAFLVNYRNSLSDSKEWYSEYTSFNQSEITLNYFLNDPFYKNKVTDFRILIDNLHLSRLKSNALEAFKSLAEITGNHDDLPQNIYFQKSADLLKFKGSYIINESSSFYIAEDGSNTLKFHIVDDKVIMTIFGTHEYTLIPHTKNSFILNEGENEQVVFHQLENGEISGLTFFNRNEFTEWVKVEE